MNKTLCGITMIGGMMLAIASGRTAVWAANVVGNPADDVYYEIAGWAGIAGALIGFALFFWGAMLFSRK